MSPLNLYKRLPVARIPAARARRDEIWERHLSELIQFRRREGHVDVPRGWSENPRLALWVLNQRRLIQMETLRLDRLQRLEQFGISWAGAEERRQGQQENWDRMLGALRAFKRSTGHLNVPRGWPVEPSLAAWVSSQRFLRKNGQLLPARERKLTDLGLDWNRPRQGAPAAPAKKHPSHAQGWEAGLAALEAYRSAHGDCIVPSRWPENPKLARWVLKQRLLRKAGRLDRDRIERLDHLGFSWSGQAQRVAARDRRWAAAWSKLTEFHREQGHSDVPLAYAPDPSLAAWVRRQRIAYLEGRLAPERVRRLESLQFPWNPPATRARERTRLWERRYSELTTYLTSGGTAEIPREGSHADLSRWLEDQRKRKQAGTLAADRTQRLEAAGVTWHRRDLRWEAQFARLEAYRREHGDCNVPTAPSRNPELARWVSAQRSAYKSGRLAPSRVERLHDLGFVWSVPRSQA